MMRRISCVLLMRGGTSRGPFLLALPRSGGKSLIRRCQLVLAKFDFSNTLSLIAMRAELLGAVALTAGALAISAGAAFGQAHLPLTEFSGVFPDGQRWQITVPANWNGTVVNDLDRIGRWRGSSRP
jgi:hypothetical protein